MSDDLIRLAPSWVKGNSSCKAKEDEFRRQGAEEYLDHLGLYGKGRLFSFKPAISAYFYIMFGLLFDELFSYKAFARLAAAGGFSFEMASEAKIDEFDKDMSYKNLSYKKENASPKDICLISSVDRPNFIEVFKKFFAKNYGFTIKEWDLDAIGQLDYTQSGVVFKKCRHLSVFLPMLSEVLGTKLSLEAYFKQIKGKNIYTFVDARFASEVEDLENVFSKFVPQVIVLGSHEFPYVFIKDEFLDLIQGYFRNVIELAAVQDVLLKNLRGTGLIGDSSKLMEQVIRRLRDYESIGILGPLDAEVRSGVVSFVVGGVNPQDVYNFFLDNGIEIGVDFDLYKHLYEKFEVPGVNSIVIDGSLPQSYYDEFFEVLDDLMFKYSLA